MAGSFYDIKRHADGLCDVTIYDSVDCGQRREYTLKGVPYRSWLEENIREHYEVWKAHAAAFEAERAAMIKVIDAIVRGLRKPPADAQELREGESV